MDNAHSNATPNPQWWNDKHSNAWDRVKEAFARDWEQTKADFSKTKGAELKQNVADTVKQAAGSEAIPPAGTPNAKPDDYKKAEPALRYGYGASQQYGDHSAWDDKLETKLKGEWNDLKSGRDWAEVKQHVKSGWDKARSKV